MLITSDIKLVSNSSTITMMHGPINIRKKHLFFIPVHRPERGTLFCCFEVGE